MKNTKELFIGSQTGVALQAPARDAAFLTPQQLADRWHFHPEHIRLMLRENRLVSMVLGRRRLIPMSAILAYESAATVGNF